MSITHIAGAGLIGAALAGLAALIILPSHHDMVEWEHGYQTDLVVGTRMHSPIFGWNLQFDFPKNPYDSDRAELFDYIVSQKGTCLEGGGFPGAPITLCLFRDVKSKDDASRKLQEIIPGLTKIVARF